MIFRRATSKDLEGLCQLRKQLANDPEDRRAIEYAPYSEKNDTAWLKRCLRAKQKFILIVEEKGSIFAHAIIAMEKVPAKMQPYVTYRLKARLVHLYVDVHRRHQGIGQNLLTYTLKYLADKGVDFVDLECYIGNDEADALYKKLGFKDVFIEKRFRFKEPLNSLQ